MSQRPCDYQLQSDIPRITPVFLDDPGFKLQQVGVSVSPHMCDVDSEVKGIRRVLTKSPFGTVYSNDVAQKVVHRPLQQGSLVGYSRLTHPARDLRDVNFNRWEYPCWNPQAAGVQRNFQQLVDTRMQAKDSFMPRLDEPLDQSTVWPDNPAAMQCWNS